MLGVARDGALCWARPGRGLYVVHRPGWGSMLGLYVGHDPGGGSKLGMAQEGALNWAWTGRGL